MAQFYIVWNEGRTEGFITDDAKDARDTFKGNFRGIYSSAGYAFHECYEDDDLAIQKLDIEPPSKSETSLDYCRPSGLIAAG